MSPLNHPQSTPCVAPSAGVVLWELLCRRRPYADSEVPSYLLMVRIGGGQLRLPVSAGRGC